MSLLRAYPRKVSIDTSVSWQPFFNICLLVAIAPMGVILTYFRIRRRPVRWVYLFTVAFPAGLFLAGMAWLFVGRCIPDQKNRLFAVPISQIQSLQIVPCPFRSLVNQALVITNETNISDIMTAVRSADEYFPNHPGTQWQCILKVSGLSGDSYVDVIKTANQGSILYCKTSQQGFIYDTLRSDTIADVLEKVAGGQK